LERARRTEEARGRVLDRGVLTWLTGVARRRSRGVGELANGAHVAVRRPRSWAVAARRAAATRQAIGRVLELTRLAGGARRGGRRGGKCARLARSAQSGR
jgi:hypothetical protein